MSYAADLFPLLPEYERGETSETDQLIVDIMIDRAEALSSHKDKALRYPTAAVSDLRKEATRISGRLRWPRIIQSLSREFLEGGPGHYVYAGFATAPVRYLLGRIGIRGDSQLAAISECDFTDILKALNVLVWDEWNDLVNTLYYDPGSDTGAQKTVTKFKNALQDTGPRAVFKALSTSVPITIRQVQTDSRSIYRQLVKDDADMPVQLLASRCSIEQGLSIKRLEQAVSGDPTTAVLSVYNPIPKTTIGVQLLINGKLIERVNVPAKAERTVTLGMLNRGTWQVNIQDVKEGDE
ncbi:MAG: hypothetical protein OXG44_01430 [Gammaproteobacteria bacterium]|nr:hypothetical protein [Gammaproteobacteria bacterium]